MSEPLPVKEIAIIGLIAFGVAFFLAAFFGAVAALIAWAVPGPGGYPAWRVAVEAGGILLIVFSVIAIIVTFGVAVDSDL